MSKLTIENTAKEILAVLNVTRTSRNLEPLKTPLSKETMLKQIESNFPNLNVISFPGTEETPIKKSVLSQVLDPIEARGGLFVPGEVDLTLPNGDIVPDKKAIIDVKTNEYVSTVGNGYQLIPNREVFTQFANALELSSLDTTGMTVRPTLTKCRSYVTFTFPKHNVEVREGDITELQIVTQNSYDGSLRFSLEIGGFRLLCSNGMGIGSYTNVYSNKHSSGYDSDKMAAYLETAVKVFETAGEEWKAMTKILVTNDQALEVLRIMTERKGNEDYEEVMNGKNGVLKDALIEWERYRNDLGQNKFALYNTVTHLSTHCSTEKGCVVGLKIYKEKVRDKALNSVVFKMAKAV